VAAVSAPNDLLADLDARGLVQDTTDREALAARLAQGPVTLYLGFDPTADSLHVGNLLGLVTLRRFQDAGHRTIALAGGATGMIGDPSGRSDERNLLDADTLAANLASIKEQIGRFISFGDGGALVDNQTWTAPIGILEFLRDVGKHVTVNQMVAKESVKARMAGDAGISYTEFSYMLLQANDFWWLNEHEGCELQVGGSDQWGNITAGIDLIRRRSGRSAHGLTWPLVARSDGVKMGKSQSGAVWLSAARTSPYQFFQWWMQIPDADVERFLLGFTLLPVDEARSVAAAHAEDPARRDGQRRLAREVTSLVHGPEQARAAEAASSVLFGGSVESVDAATLDAVAGEVPVLQVRGADLGSGLDLVDALVGAGLATSKGDARRTLEQGGASVNGVKAEPGRELGAADLLAERYVLLRKGKRSYAMVVVGGT
jgi:tyrosyl-tRNA synthetase